MIRIIILQFNSCKSCEKQNFPSVPSVLNVKGLDLKISGLTCWHCHCYDWQSAHKWHIFANNKCCNNLPGLKKIIWFPTTVTLFVWSQCWSAAFRLQTHLDGLCLGGSFLSPYTKIQVWESSQIPVLQWDFIKTGLQLILAQSRNQKKLSPALKEKYSFALESVSSCVHAAPSSKLYSTTRVFYKQSTEINIWFSCGILTPQTHHTSQLRLEKDQKKSAELSL